MTQIQSVSVSPVTTQARQINELSNNELNARMHELMSSDPIDPITPKRDVPFYTSIRNNIMLDKVLANQKIIIENQKKIMQKLGIEAKLDISG